MKRDMKQWVADTIAAPVKKPMPVLSFPAVQLMGITVRDLISSSEHQAQGMQLVAQRVDSAAAVSLMDLSVEAECFGSEIRVSDDEVPTVIGSIVTDEDEADALAVPEVGAGRTGLYIEAISKAAQAITDRPVFAGVIGPYSLAGRLLDVSEAMVLCYEEPDMVHAVMEKTTAFLIDYCKAYKAAGANGVVMAEPLTGMLSPNLAEEFSHPYVETHRGRGAGRQLCGDLPQLRQQRGAHGGRHLRPGRYGLSFRQRHPAGGHAAPRPGGPAGAGQRGPGGAAAQRHAGVHPGGHPPGDGGLLSLAQFRTLYRV